MKKEKKQISLFIYILMGYTILQFFWWTYLIFELNAEIIDLEKIIVQFSETSEQAQLILAQGNLDAVFFKKKMMILGEGGVFLLILLTGFYLIKRSHDKEIALAKQEQNFMLAITHELNSPLAAIKLNIDTLLKRSLSTQNVKTMLHRTSQEAERLNHLVNNVLATSRMEKTGFELYPENVDLVHHFNGLIKKYVPFFSQQLEVETDKELFAEIDVLAFELIFQNLLENASKYSDDDSEIGVSLKLKKGKICLRVSDYGIGIPEEEKSKVLSKFYRVGDESTRKSKGTGLGLYLVSNLVEQMKGNLTILDNTPKGTTFQVQLPT